MVNLAIRRLYPFPVPPPHTKNYLYLLFSHTLTPHTLTPHTLTHSLNLTHLLFTMAGAFSLPFALLSSQFVDTRVYHLHTLPRNQL